MRAMRLQVNFYGPMDGRRLQALLDHPQFDYLEVHESRANGLKGYRLVKAEFIFPAGEADAVLRACQQQADFEKVFPGLGPANIIAATPDVL